MADVSLADLMQSPTLRQIQEIELAQLTTVSPEFPVTDWNVGAVARTLYELESIELEDLISHALVLVAAGAAPDTATEEWLTTLAHAWFEIDRSPASLAQQTVTLACDSTHGPYTVTAGRQFLQASDGAVYVLTTGGSLSPGGTVTVDAIAETPAAARGLISRVADKGPLPGVTVQTAAIKVISGVAQFGADAQSDLSVLNAINARWPELAGIPTIDRVRKWALAADTNITRIRLDRDVNNAGGVIVTVASVAGPVSGTVVTNAQTYIDARIGITEYPTVQSASARNIVASGAVYVSTDKIPDVQAAASLGWATYLSSVEIGAEVSLEKLIQVVMDAGADDFLNWRINGAPADLPLMATEVPVPVDTLTNELGWVGT